LENRIILKTFKVLREVFMFCLTKKSFFLIFLTGFLLSTACSGSSSSGGVDDGKISDSSLSDDSDTSANLKGTDSSTDNDSSTDSDFVKGSDSIGDSDSETDSGVDTAIGSDVETEIQFIDEDNDGYNSILELMTYPETELIRTVQEQMHLFLILIQ
jgi:hypothetical protein